MAAAGAAKRNEIPSDPITNPWGARTPEARGEQWPARVDLELAEDEVEAWSQFASILHSNGDALDIAAPTASDSLAGAVVAR